MENLNVILIDDESLALDLLVRYVENTEGLHMAGKFRNPLNAVELINSGNADVVFMDIEMPQMKGIDLVKLFSLKPALVFCTAYSEYAAAAFDIDAVDYLVKPVGYERFLRSVEKVREYIEIRKSKQDGLTEQVSNEKDFLLIKADHKMVKVPISSILYIEGLGEYVKIVCEKEKFVTFQRMKKMEELLPQESFMRIHKSYILSFNHIKNLQTGIVEVSNGALLQVSRDKKEELFSKFTKA